MVTQTFPALTQGEGSELVGDRLITITIGIGRNGDIYEDTQTHGNSWADVYRGMRAVKAEVERLIEQRRECPNNPKCESYSIDASPPSLPAGNADPRVREALEDAIKYLGNIHGEVADQEWVAIVLIKIREALAFSSALPSPQSQGLVEGAEWQRSGIYIASKTKHADRWRLLRDKIGLPIKSTWIDEAGEGETSDFADLWRRNISEASSAEVLIINREKDEVLKGAWIEMGAALTCGVPVYAVGIEEFTIAKANGVTHFRHMRDAIDAAKRLVFRSRASDRSA